MHAIPNRRERLSGTIHFVMPDAFVPMPVRMMRLRSDGFQYPVKRNCPGKVTIHQALCITCSWCEKVCPEEAVTIKKFFDGEIVFNADKCPGGCSTCVDICPCNAIYLPTPVPALQLKKNSIEPTIAVNSDLCILCGACVNACPSEDVITIKRTGIHVKGPETDLYKTIAAKLCVPRSSKVREDKFGQVELKPLE